MQRIQFGRPSHATARRQTSPVMTESAGSPYRKAEAFKTSGSIELEVRTLFLESTIKTVYSQHTGSTMTV